MKLSGIKFGFNAAIMIAASAMLVFGTALAQSQDQPKPDEKPPAKEQKAEKPAPQPKETRPAHQDAKPAPSQTKDNQAKDEHQQQKQADENSKRAQDQAKQTQKDQAKQAQQQTKQAQDNAKRAQDNARIAQSQQPREQDQRSAQDRRADSGNRIPDDKFRAHFGQEHHFHVGHPVIVDNRPRFQYSGYWFEFVDPWPAEWSYDDDCYIDYVDDGYYLFDPLHPGVRIAVTIVM